ncbi:ABC transporter ATP-binding protein [Nitratireductor pacificus]|uniref:Oligopeptide ABC transporter ATP-binding protein n=1 Tax=Nitratireductor pacificus pht-3B TaxID=391937 RepID=K2N8N5_9HYPH|nr:ABC transporter ATP-binding protein [Nitratireductor pacificus]EKF20473.1 oligopeptide ABC transporter ATP-binding protein [Nitratireductor pacificus pht-3B]
MSSPLLSVEGLRVAARTRRRENLLIEDVSFDVREGEFLGIVGESGSGKSMTALSIMGLLPGPVVQATAGRVLLQGRDVLKMPDGDLRRLRGGAIGMIFQDPMTSLNPVQTIGRQIVEVVRLHEEISRPAAWERAVELLREVNIPAPEERAQAYPHQLSGGMRQRVMIAMAIACRPRLLIADEPTTALDVTIQAQILELLDRLRRERGMAVVLITHDLGVVSEYADRVLVMYSGRVVETAPVADLFAAPSHPYTRGLLNSVPPLSEEVEELRAIEGQPPTPGAWPAGCRFRPRCDESRPACARWDVRLVSVDPGHSAACLLLDDKENAHAP